MARADASEATTDAKLSAFTADPDDIKHEPPPTDPFTLRAGPGVPPGCTGESFCRPRPFTGFCRLSIPITCCRSGKPQAPMTEEPGAAERPVPVGTASQATALPASTATNNVGTHATAPGPSPVRMAYQSAAEDTATCKDAAEKADFPQG